MARGDRHRREREGSKEPRRLTFVARRRHGKAAVPRLEEWIRERTDTGIEVSS